MRLIGIMPVRNEEWVIGLSLRAALLWMDAIVVLNHCSTDGTADILAQVEGEHRGRVKVINESDPTWYEMAHRQKMLVAARKMGASHIGLIDADEVLTANIIPYVRQVAETLQPGVVLQLPWLCLWRSMEKIRSDAGSVWSRAEKSTAFADCDACHWKQRDGYEFHHTHPIGNRGFQRGFNRQQGGLFHLQFVRWRALLAKQALYKMTERIRWPNKAVSAIDDMYSATVSETGLEATDAPQGWLGPYSTLMRFLDLDESTAPWQETRCQEMWIEHGAETFDGLDLFGVVE